MKFGLFIGLICITFCCFIGFFVGDLLAEKINSCETEPQTIYKTDAIYKPIFATDTVKINGRAYLRLNTEEDTTYSHYDKYGSDEMVWYEQIELRSDLKPVDKDSSIR